LIVKMNTDQVFIFCFKKRSVLDRERIGRMDTS
jgi:hypothetical protein